MFDHGSGTGTCDGFRYVEEATHEYYAPDGQTNGMVDSKSEYESESEGGQLQHLVQQQIRMMIRLM